MHLNVTQGFITVDQQQQVIDYVNNYNADQPTSEVNHHIKEVSEYLNEFSR